MRKVLAVNGNSAASAEVFKVIFC